MRTIVGDNSLTRLPGERINWLEDIDKLNLRKVDDRTVRCQTYQRFFTRSILSYAGRLSQVLQE
ncbi:hypothetical protein ACFL0M_12105 [Thermodesulfobacteriota bacterium]